MRQWAQTETQCVPSEHQETPFNCEGDQEKTRCPEDCGEHLL